MYELGIVSDDVDVYLNSSDIYFKYNIPSVT
jgi:hypothetical protein